MKKYKSLSAGLIICNKVMLDIIFSQVIAKRYIYYGFILEQNILKTCIMWIELLLFVPFCLCYINGNTLKTKIMMFMSLMYFLPGLSIYQFIQIDTKMFVSWNVFWWLLIILGVCPIYRIKALGPFSKSKELSFAIIICVCIIVLLISWKYAGLRLKITFIDEYILRTEERKIILSRVIRYLYTSAPIVLSLGLALSIKRRKIGISILLVLIQVLNFSIGGHKTILLLTLISMGLIIIEESVDNNKRDFALLLVISGELLLEIILAAFVGSTALIANISRRVYFIPQILNIQYYSYFSENGYDYYARGPARILGIQSKYDTPLPNIISQVFWGTDGNANNGLFSEAYCNLGFLGCIVLPIFIVCIISFLSLFVEHIDYTVTSLYAFFCAFIWGSGNITTGLFTNGLLLSAIIIYLIPKEYINANSNGNKRKNRLYLWKYKQSWTA